jgi:hypothetical protein
MIWGIDRMVPGGKVWQLADCSADPKGCVCCFVPGACVSGSVSAWRLTSHGHLRQAVISPPLLIVQLTADLD